MWVRKSKCELEAEKNKRRVRYEKIIFLALAVVFVLIFWQVESFSNLMTIVKSDPERAFALLFFPIFAYFGYRNYVLHGNAMVDRPGKICLACGNGMGYSDDGWKFKVYGTNKRKWYQVRACKTPEKCDIAYQFEVKWVEDQEEGV